jgi:hypothetical protein
MDNQLIPFFPIDTHITSIRSNQRVALDEIWKAIESGEKKVTFVGSTGIGKSKIGETVLRYFKSLGLSGLYSSPLNSLVDQIEATKHIDSQIHTVKGKRYYNCVARGDGSTCDSGYCATKICYLTRNNPKGARIKRECQTCRLPECKCKSCVYKSNIKTYLQSSAGNTNSSLWLMGIVPENMKVLIIDEADSLEDFVRLNNTVSIQHHINGEDFEYHVEELSKYADSISQCLDCDNEKFDCIKNHSKHEAHINSIRNMINDYYENEEEWVIRKEINKLGDPRTKYEPITVNRFVEPLLENLDFVLAMSATPPIWKDFKRIEVSSSFPINIRQCYFKPLGAMDYRNRENNMPKLAEFLSTLKGKSLIHCNSYAFANLLSSALQAHKIWPLLQTNGQSEDNSLEYESTSRYDAVNAFVTAQDQNKIYLSVNMGRGVDLYQPDIQNNVIAVVPWSNPVDKLTIAKTKLMGEAWKNEYTAINIEQQHGRIHRGIFYLKDVIINRPDLSWLPVNSDGQIVKRTYITDTNFEYGKGRLCNWYSKHKSCFSKSFNETVVIK